MYGAGDADSLLRMQQRSQAHQRPLADYVSNHVLTLNQIPLLVLCKAALVISDDLYASLVGTLWSLLLNSDQEMASSAATLFLVCALKQPTAVEEFVVEQFHSDVVDSRYSAVQK